VGGGEGVKRGGEEEEKTGRMLGGRRAEGKGREGDSVVEGRGRLSREGGR